MPDKDQYKIVFDGRILEGHNLDDVKNRLIRLLKSDSKTIEKLLSEAPRVIKRNIDYPTASKYKEALRGAGISCQIERIENADVDVLPPPLTAAGPGSDPADALPTGTGAADVAAGTRKRPGRIWYVVAILLIVVPIVFAGIKMPLAFISYFASEIEITAPGATELIIDQPDNYVIWYTTFDGHSLRRDIPQDIKIAVYSHDPQRDLQVTPPELGKQGNCVRCRTAVDSRSRFRSAGPVHN